MKRRLSLAAAPLIFCMVGTHAGDPEVSITIPEILGHNQDNTIDAKIDARLVKKIRKSPLPYKGYKLIQRHAVQLMLNREMPVQLSEGHSLMIKAAKQDNVLKLDVTILREDKRVLGPVTIAPERSPTLIGPVKLKEGHMLLWFIVTE